MYIYDIIIIIQIRTNYSNYPTYPELNPFKSRLSSTVLSTLSRYTIFHACDLSRLQRERSAYEHLRFGQKITLGIRATLHTTLSAMFVPIPFLFLHSFIASEEERKPKDMIDLSEKFLKAKFSDLGIGLAGSKNIKLGDIADFSTIDPIFPEGSIASIMIPMNEELIYRVAIQGKLLGSLGFSPISQILGANTLFASIHLSNNETFSAIIARIQTFKLFFFPTFPILYYTTGGLAAPLAAHITSNSIAYLGLRIYVATQESSQSNITSSPAK